MLSSSFWWTSGSTNATTHETNATSTYIPHATCMYDAFHVRTPNAMRCDAVQLLQVKACPWYWCWSSRKQSRRPACKHALLDGTNWTRLCADARTYMHCTLYGVVLGTPVSFELFAWGDLSSFSRLFQQGTHDFKGQNHGRPAGRAGWLLCNCKYVRPGPYSYRRTVELREGGGFRRSGRGVVVQGKEERKRCQLRQCEQVHGMPLLTFMPSHRPMHACIQLVALGQNQRGDACMVRSSGSMYHWSSPVPPGWAHHQSINILGSTPMTYTVVVLRRLAYSGTYRLYTDHVIITITCHLYIYINSARAVQRRRRQYDLSGHMVALRTLVHCTRDQ